MRCPQIHFHTINLPIKAGDTSFDTTSRNSIVGEFATMCSILCSALILGLTTISVQSETVLFPYHCASNESGTLMLGLPKITRNRIEYCAFYGIPYASPPLNENRFQKAKIKHLLPRVDGHEFIHIPPVCKQHYRKLFGQEDCLYLNVFSKQRFRGDQNTKSPVVVWIHGGSLFAGSGLSDHFSAQSLVEEDIVVVSFNYRLNLYGFFHDEHFPVNVGLDDQRVALQWVQKNIHLFGGDPKRVTIMGWSAGSGSVTYLLYNTEAKGLFHSAIAMSGSFLSPWAYIDKPLQGRQQICDHHKIKNCSLENIVAFFGCNLSHLFSFYSTRDKSLTTNVFGTEWSMFRPGPEYPGDSPWSRMQTGPINDVPLLMGLTNNDLGDHLLGELINDPPSVVDFPNADLQKLNQAVQMLRNFGNASDSEFRKHLQMAFMFHGVYKFLDLHSKRSLADLFFFRLNYNPSDGLVQNVVHGEDLKLLFRSYDTNVSCNDDAAASFKTTWVNFIKTK